MRTPPRSSACTAAWRSRPSNADPRSGVRVTLTSATTSSGNRCHAYGAEPCQLGYRLRASTPDQRVNSSGPRRRFKWQSRPKWQKRPRIAIPGGIALRDGACLPSHKQTDKQTDKQTNRCSDTEGAPAGTGACHHSVAFPPRQTTRTPRASRTRTLRGPRP